MSSSSGSGGGRGGQRRPLPTGTRVSSFGHQSSSAGGASTSGNNICMTLHQPLASLMVWGLKRVEGRGWDSDYRGRLWIHAASLEPSPEDIARYEAFYTEVYRREFGAKAGAPQFPKHYPTSALVGCVNVVDVVSKEEFAKWTSLPLSAKLEGDGNGSGFYFLCEGQMRMVMPFMMSGQHKLWKLDKKDVERASKQLKACEQMPIDFRGHRDGKFPPRVLIEDAEDEERGGKCGNWDGECHNKEEAAICAASMEAEAEDIALALAMSLSMTET